jgi:hypothetical protein
VPADGSTVFPAAAIPEKPRDAVPEMGRRGFARTMYFRPPGPALTGFRAELVALDGKRATEIAALASPSRVASGAPRCAFPSEGAGPPAGSIAQRAARNRARSSAIRRASPIRPSVAVSPSIQRQTDQRQG